MRSTANPASIGGSSGRKKPSGLFDAQEFRNRARPQEETAVRAGRKRRDGPPGDLWIAMRCRTKARFSRVSLPHFQQAHAETSPKFARVVRRELSRCSGLY